MCSDPVCLLTHSYPPTPHKHTRMHAGEQMDTYALQFIGNTAIKMQEQAGRRKLLTTAQVCASSLFSGLLLIPWCFVATAQLPLLAVLSNPYHYPHCLQVLRDACTGGVSGCVFDGAKYKGLKPVKGSFVSDLSYLDDPEGGTASTENSASSVRAFVSCLVVCVAAFMLIA